MHKLVSSNKSVEGSFESIVFINTNNSGFDSRCGQEDIFL